MSHPLKVKYRPASSLVPYAKNARTHSAEQVAQISASIREFGFTNPVLVDESGGIIAGHGRVLAARECGIDPIPCITLAGLTEAQRRAYVIADNRIAEGAGWDLEILRVELEEIRGADFDLAIVGFGDFDFGGGARSSARGDPDQVPHSIPEIVSQSGEIWMLGPHRAMCGDSTKAEHVAALMAGNTAALLHADPPYGMGKESDGVANDNLYAAKLDAFQMLWWSAFRPHLAKNASAFIWGNAPDLWRLWYAGGLAASEVFEFRNEIVWDKKAIPGMASPDLTQFPTASERCLFFQFGKQFLGNVNTADFPPAWEPLRSYLEGEATAAGITPGDIKTACGCGMYGHWFSRSPFTLIPERHYATLQRIYSGRFERPWALLKAEWDRVNGSARLVINGQLGEARSYFDNAHDIMRDVWEFPRVAGADREGHATPKPVAMMERAMMSALPLGGICAEPFGGSGSTLMGAELTGRVCYTMELQPAYVDIIVRRWQKFTGESATLEGDGRTFDEIVAERVKGSA